MKEALLLTLLALFAIGCTSPDTAGAFDDNTTEQDGQETDDAAGSRLSDWDIRDEIEEARACTADEDCVEVGSVCPFGCSIAVNRAHEDRIGELLDSYESDCTYACAAIDRIECVANTCMAVIGETPTDDAQ